MENNKFRILLCNNIQKELNELARKQRELKNSRKLKFRPEGVCLQTICDKIHTNAERITNLIYIYRWIRHGLKYWNKRDINSFDDYFFGKDKTSWFWKHAADTIDRVYIPVYGVRQMVTLSYPQTHLEIERRRKLNEYRELCDKYDIPYCEYDIKKIFENV